MPAPIDKKARAFAVTQAQLEILRRLSADRGEQQVPDADEASACLEMWRSGLLRINGGSGYEMSRLGMAALQAQAGGAPA